MMRENLTERELFMMRRTSGAGVRRNGGGGANTGRAEEEENYDRSMDLTKEGWTSLNEIDDDWWND